jgi:hypothetical protein
VFQSDQQETALGVKGCIFEARFAGRFLQCFRAINNNGVFDDENKLKEFLSLSEERKEECTWTYKAESVSNSILESLVMVWNVPVDFERKYINDYNVVMNKEENCSAWKDKHSTMLYSGIDENNFEFQPIPDYVRWFESNGELHYLSYEKTAAFYEEIQIDVPALLLPSTVLDWLFVKNNTPPDDVLFDISILAWIPVQDVTKYFQLKRDKMEKDFKTDVTRETWRNHTLYKKSVAELQQQCRKDGLSPSGKKYELVQRLALASGEQDRSKFQPSYCGKLSSLPKSLSELKKMPIPTIKYILKSNAISYAGNKDELVLRLYLLIHGRSYLAFYEQENQLKQCITTAKRIISLEIKQSILSCDNIHRIRTYTTSFEKSKIRIPENIQAITDLHKLFSALQRFVDHQTYRNLDDSNADEGVNEDNSDEYCEYFEVGRQVKVKWTKEEIGDTGWRAGWYSAEVQKSDISSDEITIVYVSEPESTYEVEVTPLLAHGKLKLNK